jgi:L-cystine uptake protein TcyP (sodium:dicarboxylate symporter family)
LETMTHYMGLLVANQPWNLIMFMAIPVILAETIAVTELVLLFGRKMNGAVRRINKAAGLVVGFYFLGVFIYLLFNAVVPITTAGEWRGIVDVIAVGFYLLGVVPLLGISLIEVGVLAKKRDEIGKLKLHATFVGAFLVVAHIAMIFGMLNPQVLSM